MDNTIDVPEETVVLGVTLGLIRWDTQDKVHELTPKGEQVLREYLARKLAKHEG